MTQTAEIINFERPYVKADIDNGYDRLAHDLTNALMNPPVKLSAREIQIIMAVIAKTYRFHKRVDWIANTQLSEMTGIADNHISELKRQLVAKNVLVAEGRNTGINTVISEWSNIPKTGAKPPKNRSYKTSQKQESKLPKSGSNNPEYGSKTSQKQEPQKKETTTKETNTKESRYAFAGNKIKINHKDFETFKKTYPNLNLVEELAQLDIELAEEKKWWSVLHAKLNYRNKAAKSNQSSKPASRARPENFSSKDYGNDLVRF